MPALAVIPGRSRLYRANPYRPVTPEVADSSPAAPASRSACKMASSVVSTDESCDPQRGGLLPDGISLSRLFGAITCKRASSLHGNLDSAPVSSGKPVNGLSGSRPLVVTAAKRSAHAGHSDWPRRPRERLPERHESRWSRRKLCPPANRIRGKRHKGASSGYPAPVIRRPVSGPMWVRRPSSASKRPRRYAHAGYFLNSRAALRWKSFIRLGMSSGFWITFRSVKPQLSASDLGSRSEPSKRKALAPATCLASVRAMTLGYALNGTRLFGETICPVEAKTLPASGELR